MIKDRIDVSMEAITSSALSYEREKRKFSFLKINSCPNIT
jgi:hypothetical protein